MKRGHILIASVVLLAAAVHPALGAAPAGRYTTTSATVSDTKTGLTWQRATPTTTYAWADAMSYCSSVGASLGGSGWRLPTIKELATIVDNSVSQPTIDSVFTSTPPGSFWSSTSMVSMPSYAWIVAFGNGNVFGNDMSTVNFVRCVH